MAFNYNIDAVRVRDHVSHPNEVATRWVVEVHRPDDVWETVAVCDDRNNATAIADSLRAKSTWDNY